GQVEVAHDAVDPGAAQRPQHGLDVAGLAVDETPLGTASHVVVHHEVGPGHDLPARVAHLPQIGLGGEHGRLRLAAVALVGQGTVQVMARHRQVDVVGHGRQGLDDLARPHDLAVEHRLPAFGDGIL